MDTILHILEQVTTSPWLYALVFAIVAIDAFFPVVPGETVVISAAVFATAGSPNFYLLLATAAFGAFLGDHVAYQIGKGVGPTAQRARKWRWGGPTLKWAERRLMSRGGILLVAARFIPGGRTATTLSAGMLGYPRWRYAIFVALAAAAWSVYCTLIGYLGGSAFEGNPLLGVALGVGVALGIGLVIELFSRIRSSLNKPDPTDSTTRRQKQTDASTASTLGTGGQR